MSVNEQTSDQILKLFDELDALTAKPFADAKSEIDTALAKSFGIQVSELRPWHYHDPFFQEPPSIYETNLDDTFREVDIQSVCRRFYAGIGLPIDDVLAKSDLLKNKAKALMPFVRISIAKVMSGSWQTLSQTSIG